jgi:hypothetical protein
VLNEKGNGECIDMKAQIFSPIRDTEKYTNVEQSGVSVKEIFNLL